jgi:hypothetical protein
MKVMKKFDVKNASGCSKYCLGLIYFNKVSSHKRFKDTLAFIEKSGGEVSVKKVEKRKKAVVAKSKIDVIDLKKSISTSPKKKMTRKAKVTTK